MYIKNIELIGWKSSDTQLELYLSTGDLTSALNCVEEEIQLQDGTGFYGPKFKGFTRVVSAIIEGETIRLVLEKQQSLDDELTKLKAQLEATIESNSMLEECIVEMAQVVYA